MMTLLVYTVNNACHSWCPLCSSIYIYSSPIRFNFQPITVQSIYQVERDISHSEGIHGKNYRDVSHPFNHSSLHQPLQPRFVLSCIFVVSGKHGYISIWTLWYQICKNHDVHMYIMPCCIFVWPNRHFGLCSRVRHSSLISSPRLWLA